MSVCVLGAGAFGTGLSIAMGRAFPVVLVARDKTHVADMRAAHSNARRLPGAEFSDHMQVSDEMPDAEIVLLAVPMQRLAAVLQEHAAYFEGKMLVACCKGIDLETGLDPTQLIAKHVPSATPAVLTGPSFAHDIAQGLPTALTLACAQAEAGAALQDALSTPMLRLYRTTDTIGASLGGALKNVMAIACGVTMGAGLGESARAALMTRGFVELSRIAVARGAQPETLAGLSGFGDLALTCTSEGSRNYRYGFALGASQSFDPGVTVEGVATAQAMQRLAATLGEDLPITQTVAALVDGRMDVETAVSHLMARPLKEE